MVIANYIRIHYSNIGDKDGKKNIHLCDLSSGRNLTLCFADDCFSFSVEILDVISDSCLIRRIEKNYSFGDMWRECFDRAYDHTVRCINTEGELLDEEKERAKENLIPLVDSLNLILSRRDSH